MRKQTWNKRGKEWGRVEVLCVQILGPQVNQIQTLDASATELPREHSHIRTIAPRTIIPGYGVVFCIYDSCHKAGTRYTGPLAIGDICLHAFPSRQSQQTRRLTYEWFRRQIVVHGGHEPSLPTMTAKPEEWSAGERSTGRAAWLLCPRVNLPDCLLGQAPVQKQSQPSAGYLGFQT